MKCDRALWLAVGAMALAGCPSTHRYPDGSDLAGQLEREVVALQQRVRTLEFEAAYCASDAGPDGMYQDLYSLLQGTDLDLQREGSVTILTMQADYLFSGGTDLREEARMALDLLATALNAHPDHTVVVEGHTDDRPPSGDLRRLYADNWLLSYARAEAVMVALVGTYGVPAERFSIQARAHFDPVATNDTTSGQMKNRRVVVHVYPPKRSAP